MPFSSKFPMHITNSLITFLPKVVKEGYSEYYSLNGGGRKTRLGRENMRESTVP
ncbi:hypothetical protein QR685DRAFT_537325 [Neurospora intermedia]|uniref:Uncharacterized protein n=1 Tax=Neurospora intermedia TaxID=5142 RepID=A0ABR3CZ60_NEUIN